MSHHPSRRANELLQRAWLILPAMIAIGAGCQSRPLSKPAGPAAAAPGARSQAQAPTDACATNLHELSGLLLQYYLVHSDLPEKLEDAVALADALQPVSVNCPVSGKPYRYDRAGLVAPRESRRVVVLDGEPSPDGGGRWAIVTVPREGKTPLGLWVVKVSETAAQQYHSE